MKAWLTAKLVERFSRFADLLEQKRQQDIANGTYRPPLENLGQEKAPGLATEGFSDVVIPGEDPGPPETQPPAVVPARRATRLAGMTVFTD